MLSAFYGNRVIADEYNSDSEFLTTSNENSSDYVSYVVKMKTKADINGVTEDEVAVRLEDTAIDSQKSIIEFLEREKANGNELQRHVAQRAEDRPQRPGCHLRLFRRQRGHPDRLFVAGRRRERDGHRQRLRHQHYEIGRASCRERV